jgi:hypothetical protein
MVIFSKNTLWGSQGQQVSRNLLHVFPITLRLEINPVAINVTWQIIPNLNGSKGKAKCFKSLLKWWFQQSRVEGL